MRQVSRCAVLLFAGGAILLGGVAETRADFTGHTVTAQWRFPVFGKSIESHDVVVGGGVELPARDIINSNGFDIDLGGASILFDFNFGGIFDNKDFNGWWFHDTNGTIPEIIGYSIDSLSSGIANLTNDDLFFDADSVWGNFAGVTVAGGGDFINLKVTFIPEPATLSLLALGGLMLWVRR